MRSADMVCNWCKHGPADMAYNMRSADMVSIHGCPSQGREPHEGVKLHVKVLSSLFLLLCLLRQQNTAA